MQHNATWLRLTTGTACGRVPVASPHGAGRSSSGATSPSQWRQIQADLVQHVALTLIAVGHRAVPSPFPLALLAWRYRHRRGRRCSAWPARSTSSRRWRSSPSSAPITGYVASYPTAEIALVGYTLLILIWNTVAGLDAVPDDAREAAMAMGYSPAATLVRVDLPLALPYIFAGLRVATSTVIGLVTVTALIGSGRAGPADHLRLQHRLLHPDHRRPGASRSPWPAVCDLVPGRCPATWSSPGRRSHRRVRCGGGLTALPASEVVRAGSPTAANWTGSTGIPELFWRQAELSVAVVAAALVIGGGIGLVLGHTGRGGLVAVNAANASRAVPSLALLTLFAISAADLAQVGRLPGRLPGPVVLAIPPILTNTYVGMREVDADVRDAARAMGLTGGQVLRRVELPLATPLPHGRGPHRVDRGGGHLHPGRLRELQRPRAPPSSPGSTPTTPSRPSAARCWWRCWPPWWPSAWACSSGRSPRCPCASAAPVGLLGVARPAPRPAWRPERGLN